uniref:Uncharacterized protein n=1 Tax=Hyaloperonospora arabidopsidis (strain Emoy2) TaxID=559515 RepID=M4BDD8_HYAAE
MTFTGQRDVNVLDTQALNLTFMTEQLVVMGTPSPAPTDPKLNVVNVTDLAHFLDTNYSHHFMLFSCNSLLHDEKNAMQDTVTAKIAEDGNTLSLVHKLHGQMLEFNWERGNLKAHTPSFDVLFRMCYALDAYLSLDRRNVALVNCPTGKTQSGIVVACYLLFARRSHDPMDALAAFYRKRWHMKSLTANTLRQKTPPSIQRFVAEFYQLLDRRKPRNDKPMLLKTVVLRKLPVDHQPCVQIYDDYKLVFCTDTSKSEEESVLDWDEEDGCFTISWKSGLELDGGFSLLCSFGGDYDHVSDMDASSRVLFRYTDSTLFLVPGLVTLKRHDLDLMKRYEHGFDDDEFLVELGLHENSTKQPRDMVRMDYSGRSALCQGLIEITKHHIVLPDPSLHLALIRMGFSDTPTTFALQCSQNTPSLALEMLRCNPLSTCFVQETQERAAERIFVEPTHDSQNPHLVYGTMSNTRLVDGEPSTAPAAFQGVAGESSIRSGPKALGIMSIAMAGQRRATIDVSRELGRLNEDLVSSRLSSENLIKATTGLGSVNASITVSFANNLKSADASTLSRPSNEDTKDTFSNKQSNPGNTNDSNEMFALKSTGNKYTLMLKRGVPFKAVQNCMQRENVDPSTLEAVFPSKSTTADLSSAIQANGIRKRRLKDVNEFSTYFRMLRMGCPEEAVRQKITMDGIDPVIMDLGSDAIYDEVKNRITSVEKSVQKPSTAINGKDIASEVSLEDYNVYTKYYVMLKMGVQKGAVRQKMKADGVDMRVLDQGGNDSLLAIPEHTREKRFTTTTVDGMNLMDHPESTKHCELLLASLSEGAIQKEMKAGGVNEGVLDVKEDAVVWQVPNFNGGGNRAELQENFVVSESYEMKRTVFHDGNVRQQKKKDDGTEESALGRRRNMPILDTNGVICDVNFDEDTLDGTYLTGLPEDAVKSNVVSDSVEVHGLDLGTDASISKLDSSVSVVTATAEPLKRARKKLHWQAISEDRLQNLNLQKTIWEDEDEDVQVDVDMDELEALFFAHQSTGSATKDFLRGSSKALKRKQTVTLFNGKRAMNAAISLARVKLTYREIAKAVENFDPSGLAIQQLTSINESLPTSDEAALVSRYTGDKEMLGEQSVETRGLEATIMLMQAAAADIDARMKMIRDGVSRAREEVSSVLDYFGEDPNRNPSEFFTTLASFCTAFQQARNEVDAADEIARQKERLTIRRLNTLRPLPKSTNGATMKMSCQVLERPDTEHTTDERQHHDEP